MLYNLLRKIRVIGVVSTVTETVRYTEMSRSFRYNLKFVGYDPSMKGKLTPYENWDLYSINALR